MAKRTNRKQIDTNGQTAPSVVPLDQQVTEDGTLPEEVVVEVSTEPVTKSERKAAVIKMLQAGMSISMVAKELEVRYQVVRAYALSAGLHTSSPRGSSSGKALKLTVRPDQVQKLREVLVNAVVEDGALLSILHQFPAEE